MSDPKTTPADTDHPANSRSFRSMGRAFAHPNFRLFFMGQTVSMIGGWMTRVATGWLVFRLSGPHSAFLLGIVGFTGQAPAFFVTPIAGVLVDRWNRHRLLVVTQSLLMIHSALLATVAFWGNSGPVTIGLIIGLSLVEGFVNAFDMPARQAFLMEMVTRSEDRANAIALNSSLVNGARLVGPTLAGLLIAVAGEAWCFVVDAASSIAIIAALLAMTVTPREIPAQSPPLLRGLREGFAYAFGFAPIRSILLLLALVSFMGMPYSILMPIFAAEILVGGPSTLGLLSTASGAGALTGALYLASRSSVLGLGRVIVLATSTFGLALVGFALSRSIWLSVPMLVLAGLGMMVQMAACNTILQTIVDDDKRGRVMSFYGMAFLGIIPFGSLFAGVMAATVGPTTTVVIGGLACVAGAVTFASCLPRLRTLVRPIYIERGILPEIATGLQAATAMTQPPED